MPGSRLAGVPAGAGGECRSSRRKRYSEISGISGPWLYSGVTQARASEPKPSQ